MIKRKIFFSKNGSLSSVEEYFDEQVAPFIRELGDNFISISEYASSIRGDMQIIFAVFYREWPTYQKNF